jgi:hypothetical protein
MGKTFSKMFDKWFGLQEMRVLRSVHEAVVLPLSTGTGGAWPQKVLRFGPTQAFV